MEYSESQARLIQAQRKSPEVGALGFRLQVQKLLVIVELLMGEIPSRQVFNTAEYQKPLTPYFQIVQCAKSGDMEKFRQLITQYQKVFQADKNLTLVQRLRHTVIKFGLKKINISYSKISIPDIKKRLGLDSVEETEHIVAKAIRDGVIDAVLNHDKQWMESLPITDVYASNDPQHMLDKRIRFCMDLHNDAIKGL
jgi:26S proteasome regulatory subunit N3